MARKTAQIRFRLSPDFKRRIALAARVSGRPMSELVRDAVRAETEDTLRGLDLSQEEDDE